MKSSRNARFDTALSRLPERVRNQAREAYRLFENDPFHDSLQFKSVSMDGLMWSVRVGAHYRALGWRRGDAVTWFWIGTHAEYDQLLRRR